MKNLLTLLTTFACLSFATAQDLFFDGFENGLNWTLIDADNDGQNWTLNTTPEQIIVASGSACAYSISWSQATDALTPNNYMISPAIDIPQDASAYVLEWKALAQDQTYSQEHYKVVVANGVSKDAVDAGTVVYDGEVGANGGYKTFGASLSDYAGQTIHIAFVHNEVTNQFMLNIDDVRIFKAQALDAKVAAVNVDDYAKINTQKTVGASIINEGASIINSLELSYTVGSNTPVVQVFDGLALSNNAQADLSFDQPITIQNENAEVTVKVLKVNGQDDVESANNSLSKTITVVTDIVNKTILIEEGTGTWCGFCPRGAVGLDAVTKQYNNVIGVAVHSGDIMAINGYDNFLNFQGLPAATVNRRLNVDPDQVELENAYRTLKDEITPVSFEASATYNPSTEEVTVDITSNIHVLNLSGDYRLNVILTEDGVTGTGPEYAQTNYFANNANGEMGGFEKLPNPVPAEDMVYNHVARLLMGGMEGDENSFPSNVSYDQKPSYRYVSKIDTSWNVNKMHAVVILVDRNNDGQVINAHSAKIQTTVSNVEIVNNNVATISPNPYTETTYANLELDGQADVSISILNMLGQQMHYQQYGKLSGQVRLPISAGHLTEGSYIVQIRHGRSVTNKKILKIK